MTPTDKAITESHQAMVDLVGLVAELNQHTQRLRREIASLAFVTMVQATDVSGEAPLRMLGGERGVRVAVAMLYERVMEDPALAGYFSGTDMVRVRRRQADMFLALFGVQSYRGRSLRLVHQHLHITHEHVERLLDHVAGVLRDLGVSRSDTAAFVDRLSRFEDEIVGEE